MFITFSQAQAMQAVLRKFSDQEMSVKQCYKIMKFLLAIERESNVFAETYDKIISEYAERDANGKIVLLDNGNIKIATDKIEKCKNKIEELNNLEIELPDCCFTLEELEDVKLTPRELYAIEPILK
jgi:dissimilatory sulfite reductase (desulfoviridin) alpha/beta subunit